MKKVTWNMQLIVVMISIIRFFNRHTIFNVKPFSNEGFFYGLLLLK